MKSVHYYEVVKGGEPAFQRHYDDDEDDDVIIGPI